MKEKPDILDEEDNIDEEHREAEEDNDGKETREELEEVAQGRFTDYRLLGLIVGISIIILIIIFALPHIYKPKPKSINELHQEVMEGADDEDHYLYNGFSFVKIGNQNVGYMWYTQVLNPNTNIK